MRILVTGGDGFIGSKLVALLRKRGHYVREFKGEIADKANVERQVRGFDAVCHLAALIDETAGRQRLFEVNVNGTKNVLEAAAQARVQRFLHVSTVGVHGEAREKIDENAAFHPETGYEQSKAEAEKLVHAYLEVLPLTIVRPALVLGANEYWRKIIDQVAKGFPLIGSGKNRWQIVYVDDLVEALAGLLGREDAIGETYIVAEEKPSTLREIYEEINHQLGRKEPVKTLAPVAAKALSYVFLAQSLVTGKKSILLPQHVDRVVRNREYSIEKIKALGWKPKYDAKAAVAKMFEEFKENGVEWG
ncbi:MAG: NAD-dependent epimerase/dehydratase family protein [Candidatus Diapherotrites archaeon]|uniref:NAD-dependent epimerase/dehydratase family protein n=2 Tax=Candidatus Iainarchaeum sp. TaxID=3101447 RepID=A0A8T4LAJ6_9ARCH|nr:NAD-dependent epimerase/dehydratase family protein [Candidatus Diapherotrites archaeon]